MKVMVCRCEDVSLSDIEHALAQGYSDIEEVKRYTGFGTGMCQGKECHALVASIILKHTGHVPKPFTARAPLLPVPIGQLAAEFDEVRAEDGNHPSPDGHE